MHKKPPIFYQMPSFYATEIKSYEPKYFDKLVKWICKTSCVGNKNVLESFHIQVYIGLEIHLTESFILDSLRYITGECGRFFSIEINPSFI